MIAIIGALQIEVEAILNLMDTYTKKMLHCVELYEGVLCNQQVVVAKSGVGKVQASITTTVLLTNFDIDMVINIGTAGGMKKSQNTLDVVIATEVCQHDFDTTYVDGKQGLGKRYQADITLLNNIKNAFDNTVIHTGLIVSGDCFVGEESKIEAILKIFPDAIACEMEAGAIAQVCAVYQKPFAIVRSLSDIVYHDNSNIDFMENAKITSVRSANMLKELLHG